MNSEGQFTACELALLLDAVVVLYKNVEAAPANDGSNLPEIDALQHKVEWLLCRAPA
jgi:hypothetical protein